MRIQHHRLRGGEARLVAVQVRPARLRHPDTRIREVPHHAAQEIRPRHEVGIEHGDQLAARAPHSPRERARLVSRAAPAAEMRDVEPACSLPRDGRRGARRCVIRGVVQDLDLEPLARIVERGRRIDQTLDDAALVVNRKLHRDDRKIVVREQRS